VGGGGVGGGGGGGGGGSWGGLGGGCSWGGSYYKVNESLHERKMFGLPESKGGSLRIVHPSS